MAWGYGHPRVMSSYTFNDTEAGPPTESDGTTIQRVHVVGSGEGEDGDMGCSRGWVCEHRWQAIAGMVSFSKAVGNSRRWNYWNGGTRGSESGNWRVLNIKQCVSHHILQSMKSP